jgi:hypothetical protein
VGCGEEDRWKPWQAVLQAAGFVYHCSDRVVSHGHLPLLDRPARIVHFSRRARHLSITKHALAQRTEEVSVGSKRFARNHPVSLQWAEKAMKKACGRKNTFGPTS